jgi:hypothetical protein
LTGFFGVLTDIRPLHGAFVLLAIMDIHSSGVVKDTNMSPEIQQRFAASYKAAGGKMQLELLPGAPHNFVNRFC